MSAMMSLQVQTAKCEGYDKINQHITNFKMQGSSCKKKSKRSSLPRLVHIAIPIFERAAISIIRLHYITERFPVSERT
jgi:hypothetical protein